MNYDLLALLARYGRHDDSCPLHGWPILPGDSRCTCGFSAAYAIVDPQSADWQAEARAKATRMEAERPADGVPIPTSSPLELAAYRMPNGSKFVTLIDDREETWESYCLEEWASPTMRLLPMLKKWSGI